MNDGTEASSLDSITHEYLGEDPDVFAIECRITEYQPNLGLSEHLLFINGFFRFWGGGIPFGDFDYWYYIHVPYWNFIGMLKKENMLNGGILCTMSTSEVNDLFYCVLYGDDDALREQAPVIDDDLRKYELTNGFGPPLDGSYLRFFECEDCDRLMWGTRSASHEAVLPRGLFFREIERFMAWYRSVNEDFNGPPLR